MVAASRKRPAAMALKARPNACLRACPGEYGILQKQAELPVLPGRAKNSLFFAGKYGSIVLFDYRRCKRCYEGF